MMAISKTEPLVNLRKSAAKMISAHEAIREGIATHAQKHNAATDAKRRQAEQTLRIAEGTAKHNATIPSAG